MSDQEMSKQIEEGLRLLEAYEALMKSDGSIHLEDGLEIEDALYRHLVTNASYFLRTLPARVADLEAALAENEQLKADNEGYKAALDPDQTKAAYIGKIGFYIDDPNDDEKNKAFKGGLVKLAWVPRES